MSEKKRLRREDPPRTECNRSAFKLLDQEEPGSSGAVAYGARLGYQVIEEQIRLGQKISAGIASTREQGPMTGADLPDMIERMGRFYTDMFSSYFEILAPLTENVFKSESSPTSSAPNTASFELAVNVQQPVRVALKIDSTADSEINVSPLHDASGDHAPIQGARVERRNLSLLVELALDSVIPHGIYNGVLTDEQSKQPIGTISIQVDSPVI